MIASDQAKCIVGVPSFRSNTQHFYYFTNPGVSILLQAIAPATGLYDADFYVGSDVTLDGTQLVFRVYTAAGAVIRWDYRVFLTANNSVFLPIKNINMVINDYISLHCLVAITGHIGGSIRLIGRD